MNEGEIKALLSLLDDDDPAIFSMISKKINEIGYGIIPYLEEEWENNFNPLVQKRIEDLTHDLQFLMVKDRLKNWHENESSDLLKGIWIVATYQYPDLEYEKISHEIEQLFYEVWLNFKPDLHPYDQIKILNSVLFFKLKFAGNLKNFHSPSNSYINCVLETKKGNPISICIVYLLICRKLGLPVFGVNLPNLFILTYKDPRYDQFYINAYNKGLIFTRADIENYIKEIKLTPHPVFLEPCDDVDIIRRVLRNLIISYEKAGEKEKKEEIMELLQIIHQGDDILNV
ncbi:MAG: transglutaminase-like domain-containing protein [Cyclobacteriaceae bacterium]|nr:transglutaminase-like domain-containing protein [Cyclobacteriaceae bacterium]